MSGQEIAQKFADILQGAVLEVDPSINFTWKRMFGGAGFYVNGKLFASWYRDEQIAIKLAEADRAALLEVEGAAMANKQAVDVPDSILNDVTQLATWTAKSIEFVMSLPEKKKKKKKKRP